MLASFPVGRRLLWPLVAVMLAAGLPVVPAAKASADACPARTSAKPVSPGARVSVLTAVAVPRACSVWAVGYFSDGGGSRTLTEHWNGRRWTVLPSPDPGSGDNVLASLSVVSASSIWAVGDDAAGTRTRTLVLHWNGRRWARVASPSPGTLAVLTAVHAVSARDVWAVGLTGFTSSGGVKALIEHWNGRSWRRVAAPSPGPPGSDTELRAVTGLSRTSVWAGGFSATAEGVASTLIERWNGRRWRRIASPGQLPVNRVTGIGAVSAGWAWAAGGTASTSAGRTLVLRWNGRRWTRISAPSPGLVSSLAGLAAVSRQSAWAVGDVTTKSGTAGLVLRWNGRRWIRAAVAGTARSGTLLNGVGAASATDMWAVGSVPGPGGTTRALTIHCC